MTFPSIGLKPTIIAQLNDFMATQNLDNLYQAYNWQNDTHANGFPDIQALETQLIRNDLNGGITLINVISVAKWEHLRNCGRINGPSVVLPQNTFNIRLGHLGPVWQVHQPTLISTSKGKGGGYWF